MIDDAIRQRILTDSAVRHLECHDELVSTNDRGLQLITQENTPLPAVVLAERQTAGRGRGNNRWWSGGGSLTFSLLADESTAGYPVGRDPRTALLTGLALADTLCELLPPEQVTVKWPNDVLIGGRKVAGILVEIPPSRRTAAVIGIGLNVNNPLQKAPSDLQLTATSLCDELGRTCNRSDLLLQLLNSLDRRFAAFGSAPESLANDWRLRCALSGHRVEIQRMTGPLTGRCCGIHADGSLLIETENGLQAIQSATSVRIRSS